MKKLIIVKIGGSLITDKTKPYTARLEIIKEISRQIQSALEEDKDLELIIGNGAGSFGHYSAMKYKVTSGVFSEEQKMGFCVTQDGVSRLNRFFTAELLRADVKAISVHPSSMITADNTKVKKFFFDPILGILSMGVTPVVYGDIVYDRKNGATIFSTEQVLAEIVKQLSEKNIRVHRFIHVGVVPGVLDSKGKIIPLIRSNELSKHKKHFYTVKGFDVTGGMLHKVEESIQLAKQGIETLIIGGTENNILTHALTGKKVKGTIIR